MVSDLDSATNESIKRNIAVTYSITEVCNETPEYMLLPRIKFKLGLEEFKDDPSLKETLLNAIKRNNMTRYYDEACKEFKWDMDKSLYDAMQRENTTTWNALESATNDVNLDNCGKENWREKLDYACSIGDTDRATSLATCIFEDKSNSTSSKAEAAFCLFRIAYFRNSISGMCTAIKKAMGIIERGCSSGSDWCCRNKLKVYEAIYQLATRNYAKGAALLLESVPTFESHELLPFSNVVRYTVLACMITLPRSELNSRLNKQGILLQTLMTECPKYKEYFLSLYDCHYALFFTNLAWIESEMRTDPLLHPHCRHYVREMRIRAYSQLLQAYRTLSLERMAVEFGVTTSYIEQEIARFISNGRLRCKIDRISESIITMSSAGCDKGQASDTCERGMAYQNTIKKGDMLLNRQKKLARIIDF